MFRWSEWCFSILKNDKDKVKEKFVSHNKNPPKSFVRTIESILKCASLVLGLRFLSLNQNSSWKFARITCTNFPKNEIRFFLFSEKNWAKIRVSQWKSTLTGTEYFWDSVSQTFPRMKSFVKSFSLFLQRHSN